MDVEKSSTATVACALPLNPQNLDYIINASPFVFPLSIDTNKRILVSKEEVLYTLLTSICVLSFYFRSFSVQLYSNNKDNRTYGEISWFIVGHLLKPALN